MLPIHVSDTAATSQDGSIFNMQGAEGCFFFIDYCHLKMQAGYSGSPVRGTMRWITLVGSGGITFNGNTESVFLCVYLPDVDPKSLSKG